MLVGGIFPTTESEVMNLFMFFPIVFNVKLVPLKHTEANTLLSFPSHSEMSILHDCLQALTQRLIFTLPDGGGKD